MLCNAVQNVSVVEHMDLHGLLNGESGKKQGNLHVYIVTGMADANK